MEIITLLVIFAALLLFWFYFFRHKETVFGAFTHQFGLTTNQRLQLMQAILDNDLTCIFVKDTQHRYLLINQYGYELFQKKPENILGKTDLEVFSPAYAASSKNSENLLLENGRTQHEENELEINGIKRYLSTIKTPLKDSYGNIYGICGFAYDITSQRNAQQNLNSYLEKLETVATELMEARILAEQASKAKNAFLANISHELRTPLHAVLGSITLLLHSSISEKQMTHILRIKDSTKLLLEIIGNVLDLSKIASGELKLESIPTKIPLLVQECYNIIATKADEKGIEFNVSLPEQPLADVRTDRTRLKQVLVNLLSNAIKFTEKGRIGLAVQIVSQAPGTLHLRFVISDTGIGISEIEMQHLFERFWQADATTTRKYGGTGLGLAISKEIVDLMGGTINALSKPGEGTIFTVNLPFFVAHQTDIHKI